jgi:hypothetical protein
MADDGQMSACSAGRGRSQRRFVGYNQLMRLRRDLIVPLSAVAAALPYFAFVPVHWYERHVAFWLRLPVGIVLRRWMARDVRRAAT